MPTCKIQRVFWKDFCVNASYNVPSLTQNALRTTMRKALTSAPHAGRAHGHLVLEVATRKALQTGVLSSVRSQMPLAVAIGLSCAVSGSSMAPKCPAQAAAKLGVMTAQYALEYGMWSRMKTAVGAPENGGLSHMAVSFAAGTLANAAATIAFSRVPGACASAPFLSKAFAASCATAGVGYAAVDKTFQSLYLGGGDSNKSKSLAKSKTLTKSASTGNLHALFNEAALPAPESVVPEAAASLRLRSSTPKMKRPRSISEHGGSKYGVASRASRCSSSVAVPRSVAAAPSRLASKKPVLALTY